ncbi:type I-B CRISPR-associated protein Cas8b1/Cst1 [Kiritimatiellaeota bacterium B1221]|nr:type I-B CRISPR-associated protein Cas8b1/Cst1 [Kiritimatiellaeota bacterium B1221]
MRDDYTSLLERVEPGVFSAWQKVDVEVYAFTDLGIKVAINDEYTGLVYGNQVYKDYREGQKLDGYIKQIREDGKIDVSLQPPQDRHVFDTSEKIMAHLRSSGGRSHFHSKSSPEEIEDEFQVSKKIFKQAVGRLYKQKKILVTDQGIELVRK